MWQKPACVSAVVQIFLQTCANADLAEARNVTGLWGAGMQSLFWMAGSDLFSQGKKAHLIRRSSPVADPHAKTSVDISHSGLWPLRYPIFAARSYSLFDDRHRSNSKRLRQAFEMTRAFSHLQELDITGLKVKTSIETIRTSKKSCRNSCVIEPMG